MLATTSLDGRLKIWDHNAESLVFDSMSKEYIKGYKVQSNTSEYQAIIGRL